ncbi:hypothetical protein RhiJN_05260 [Ceratobasidium sp. AG-Ba]|nr:hypothetical protein RhiJN_05260 [Ceratobasidium sp. AG-Ba]QRW06175.1 hypothetical protein RhiLY_05174 [Ceratobasidium sp. AG-Ba]
MASDTGKIGPLPNAFGENEDHYWDGDDETAAKPLVELEMVALSRTLRSKPSWWTKFRDPEILAKWRAEALEQANLMKESHIDYVLAELDGYANLRDEETGAEVACYDRIWQSDRLVPPALNEKLKSSVSKLENIPDNEKDWHPNSNEMVLDLVHPSLYPVVYGRTMAYSEGATDRDPSKLAVIPPPVLNESSRWEHEANYHVSRKFQWLPTDFAVSEDGKSVKSASYINNLHPDHHRDLHEVVEGLIGSFLPLFERVLTDSIPANRAVPERTNNSYSYKDDYKPAPSYQQYSDRNEYHRLYEEWSEGRPICLPDVDSEGYKLGSLEKRDIWYSLGGKTIQVIVKLANIHLTPQKPEYAGGSWHVEGMSNESIAVSGIYYYDEENITESRLAFRTAAAVPGSYEQSDERGCTLTWGISTDEPCVNELGAVVTCQDRAIAFPNIYQHRVSPFQLQDKTKPGHRKIVALFLVDPAVHIPSTTRVPPQQHEWRANAVFENVNLKTALGKLAPEIVNHINTLAEGTMSREEANAYRLELMEERKAFVVKNDEKFFEVAFSMCEH